MFMNINDYLYENYVQIRFFYARHIVLALFRVL